MKKRYLIGVLICIVLAAILLWRFLRPSVQTSQPLVPPEVRSSASESESGSSSEPELPFTPVDFEEQQKINDDIYAWITIPGTVVDYPVLQHKSDDTYYLDHNIYGKKTTGGALFTERVYNGKDFNDPVTIIYGHKLKSGAMFGSLQALYSDPSGFAANRAVYVQTPDGCLEYEIFATLPYDNRHILYNYDFTNARVFRSFFKNVTSVRTLGANSDPEYVPDAGDRVLILSTCLRGDNTKRYLVMARQVS